MKLSPSCCTVNYHYVFHCSVAKRSAEKTRTTHVFVCSSLSEKRELFLVVEECKVEVEEILSQFDYICTDVHVNGTHGTWYGA